MPTNHCACPDRGLEFCACPQPAGTSFAANVAAAQNLKQQLDAARAILQSALAAGVSRLAPVGSIIDRRSPRFGTVDVAQGNGRNALCFEVASNPVVDLSLTHPGLTRFTIDAYPLNEAGKRMSGRVAKSYGLGLRETVQLRIDILPQRHDYNAEQELSQLAAIAAEGV